MVVPPWMTGILYMQSGISRGIELSTILDTEYIGGGGTDIMQTDTRLAVFKVRPLIRVTRWLPQSNVFLLNDSLKFFG